MGKRLHDLRKTVMMVDTPPKLTPKRSARGRGRGGRTLRATTRSGRSSAGGAKVNAAGPSQV